MKTLSNVCGQYCAVYLLHRCRGVPMKTFVKSFGNYLVDNDCSVFDFVKSNVSCLRVMLFLGNQYNCRHHHLFRIHFSFIHNREGDKYLTDGVIQ